jgi:hypothetical protein
MSIRDNFESYRRKLIGITLQEHGAKRIRETFPELSEDDVKSTPPSIHGADLQLSEKASTALGHPSFEMKSDKSRFKSLYKAIAQAKRQAQIHENPIVVLTDHSDDQAEPLAVMDFEKWLIFSRLMYEQLMKEK